MKINEERVAHRCGRIVVTVCGGLAVATVAACTQPRPRTDASQAAPPGLLVNYTMPEESPLVLLDGRLLHATERDSLLANLRGAVLDSIRVYPAGSTAVALFGSRGAKGVVVIATRASP